MTKIHNSKEITSKLLLGTDDWRDFYLEQGQEMLDFGRKILKERDEELIDMGVKIIEEALFEEDIENWDSPRSLARLDFSGIAEMLVSLLGNEKLAPRALYGMWVCYQEGAKVKVESRQLEKFLDKSFSKTRVRGMSMQSLALRILLHILAQQQKVADFMPYLKKGANLKNDIFEEIAAPACLGYDLTPFLAMAKEGILTKSEATVRDSITTLWKLMRANVDIDEVIPSLFENQEKLRMSTDVLQLLAGYYVQNEKYADMEAWLDSQDPKISLNAYRGLIMAKRNGIDAAKFYSQNSAILDALADKNGLPKINES